MYPSNEYERAHQGRVEYVVAEAAKTTRQPHTNNPCESGSAEECADWVRERMMALYNE